MKTGMPDLFPPILVAQLQARNEGPGSLPPDDFWVPVLRCYGVGVTHGKLVLQSRVDGGVQGIHNLDSLRWDGSLHEYLQTPPNASRHHQPVGRAHLLPD